MRPATLLVLTLVTALAAACATARQRVQLDVVGDVPTQGAKGRRLSAKERQQAAASRTIVVVAGFPCPTGTVDRTRECPTAPPRRITIDPLASHLGPPPTPAEVAGRMVSGYPRAPERRATVRTAYRETVRSRYRVYAGYVASVLREADWVEIVRADGSTTRLRGARLDAALEAALLALADLHADGEWARFETTWPRRARRPPAAPTPPEPDAAPVVATPPAAPAPGDDLCRQACQLRWRACLARCRGTPVGSGAYDACTYECGATDADCRAGCGSGG